MSPLSYRVSVQYRTSQHHQTPLTHTVVQTGDWPWTVLAGAVLRLEREGAGRWQDITEIRMEPQ